MSREAWIFVAAVAVCCGAGCKSPKAVAVDPEAERVVFYESQDPTTERTVREYETSDGQVLGYVEHKGWQSRTAMVVMPGLEGHSGWFEAFADKLAGRGHDVLVLDRRGSGLNRENRGFTSGHYPSYETVLRDAEALIEPLHEQYDQVYLMGAGLGGKLATAYALRRPDDIDGLVLLAPTLSDYVDHGLMDDVRIVLGSVFYPESQVQTATDPAMFVNDEELLAEVERDPLRLDWASARAQFQDQRLDSFIARRMPTNQVPIQLLLAGGDQVVNGVGTVQILETGEQERLDVMLYGDQPHAVELTAPQRLVSDVSWWLGEVSGTGRAGSVD